MDGNDRWRQNLKKIFKPFENTTAPRFEILTLYRKTISINTIVNK